MAAFLLQHSIDPLPVVVLLSIYLGWVLHGVVDDIKQLSKESDKHES